MSIYDVARQYGVGTNGLTYEQIANAICRIVEVELSQNASPPQHLTTLFQPGLLTPPQDTNFTCDDDTQSSLFVGHESCNSATQGSRS